MTVQALLVNLRDQLLGGAWGPMARGRWCRKQRRELRPPGHRVVWVSREALPWQRGARPAATSRWTAWTASPT